MMGLICLIKPPSVLKQRYWPLKVLPTGSVGEVDLETYQDALVFNVDIGNADVKVDFSDGAILGQELETDDH